MRARISKKNVNYFLRQQYGIDSSKQFFELTKYHSKFKNKVVAHMVKEFTGYEVKANQLVTYNPYTSKYEALNIEGFDHIFSTEDLFKDLSMLHKKRMNMLEQSRERILEISKSEEKKYSRDKDLEVISEKRWNELQSDKEGHELEP